jgi:glycosyltransferase involved in cell wall biosynthesis
MKSILRIPALLKIRSSNPPVLFSTSDFPGDSLPALVMKILRPRCIWIGTFYLFAPSPLSAESPYHGSRILRSVLWSMAQCTILSMIRRFADVVFVTNEIDRRRVADAKRLTIDRVIAVRGGVDLRMSLEVPDSPSKNYEAVFIGRLHPQKGVLELVEIWKLVCRKSPEAQLAIIGNGELEGEIRALINRSGLSNNITMLGFVDGYEKIRVFKESKIVLHPAIYDSGGMAPAEAMACGLPGICFDLPALRTYYPRGMIKIPRNDLHKFAEEVTLLLNDSERYATLSKEAIEQSKSWDWDLNASKVLVEIRQNPLPKTQQYFVPLN